MKKESTLDQIKSTLPEVDLSRLRELIRSMTDEELTRELNRPLSDFSIISEDDGEPQ